MCLLTLQNSYYFWEIKLLIFNLLGILKVDEWYLFLPLLAPCFYFAHKEDQIMVHHSCSIRTRICLDNILELLLHFRLASFSYYGVSLALLNKSLLYVYSAFRNQNPKRQVKRKRHWRWLKETGPQLTQRKGNFQEECLAVSCATGRGD